MTKTDVALLPCPFCARGNPDINDQDGIAWLGCPACKTEGPTAVATAEAIAAWNTRPTPDPTADPTTYPVDLIDALEELATWLRLNGGPRADQVMKARAAIAAIPDRAELVGELAPNSAMPHTM